MVTFIKTIATGLDNTMNEANMSLMLDLTNEHFYEDMKDMEKDDPARLDQILAAHFVTKFVLDIMQFSCAHFVRAKAFN